MTYALAWPLQKALYATLIADPTLISLVGEGHFYDEPPHGESDETPDNAYVVIGDEAVTPWDTKTERGAIHTFDVIIYTQQRGYSLAKQIAGRISDLLETEPLTLARGRIINLNFENSVTAREDQGLSRQITLTFRAVLEDTSLL